MKLFLDLPLLSFMKGMVISLPAALNLSLWWNLGSLLFLLMVTQIVTGYLLTFYYSSTLLNSFESVWLLHLESFNGSILHWVHMNNASFIFFFLYLHLLKALHYESFKSNKLVYSSGFVILVLSMLTAFLGYVLPFGQMSLWGATVITNLLSVISPKLVIWVWGGYAVNELTLNLFYSLHFLFPFIILVIMIAHLWVLHYNGSTHYSTKSSFYPFYLYKDLLNVLVMLLLFYWTLNLTYLTSDAENFLLANPSVSPLHIKPEWYFLVYYAILRSIPNKPLGVFMFAMSLFMLLILVLNFNLNINFYYPSWSSVTSFFVVLNLLLMLIGGSPVETPFLEMGQVLTIVYFSWFIFVLSV